MGDIPDSSTIDAVGAWARGGDRVTGLFAAILIPGLQDLARDPGRVGGIGGSIRITAVSLQSTSDMVNSGSVGTAGHGAISPGNGADVSVVRCRSGAVL